MYINAYIPFTVRLLLYCDLSHDNFISLIEFLHSKKFETEITDGGEWQYYTSLTDEEDKFTYTLWADDETIEDVKKTAECTLKLSKKE